MFPLRTLVIATTMSLATFSSHAAVNGAAGTGSNPFYTASTLPSTASLAG